MKQQTKHRIKVLWPVAVEGAIGGFIVSQLWLHSLVPLWAAYLLCFVMWIPFRMVELLIRRAILKRRLSKTVLVETIEKERQ